MNFSNFRRSLAILTATSMVPDKIAETRVSCWVRSRPPRPANAVRPLSCVVPIGNQGGDFRNLPYLSQAENKALFISHLTIYQRGISCANFYHYITA
jgi:hypothetical protein